MTRLACTLSLLSSLCLVTACGAPATGPGTGPDGEDCSDTATVDLTVPFTQWEGTHEGLAMSGFSGAVTLEFRLADKALVVTTDDGTVFEDEYDPSQCDTASVGADGYSMTLAMHEGERLMTLGIAGSNDGLYAMSLTVQDDTGILLGATFAVQLEE